MIVILGAILGAVSGALIAKRRKGRVADILQYAFVYALIFALAGLFITLIVHRSSV
ncbi:hypothetical protein BXY70_0054 [Roseovarius halotolerans]|uniref:Apolipoprotein acyltransferase n=1 Tax=Roseovarius halotolerans TaxID=505353 RepID=A0A1X6YPK8_9RHOB|nr:solute carrier organic anion transporter [Roseovarius halotolerans]RKT34051.1 hypothetical protein BXY70_0054 [Roseovarius halotolerans]SLN27690.1 hypothetical protein ROH8110_01341 [Roseovarius halotolerans]